MTREEYLGALRAAFEHFGDLSREAWRDVLLEVRGELDALLAEDQPEPVTKRAIALDPLEPLYAQHAEIRRTHAAKFAARMSLPSGARIEHEWNAQGERISSKENGSG